MNDHAIPPSELAFEGNMADNWNFFKQKFEIYLNASKLVGETDKNKGFILLNRIGDKALKIYNNFTWNTNEEKTCSAILNKFQAYFTPTKNVTYERYLFFTRNKKQMESFDEYVTDLRQLATSCEFSSLTDSLIKDRLILGIQDSSMKDRLLREPNLTLTRALELCRAAEIASERLKVIDGNTRGVHEHEGVNAVRNLKGGKSRMKMQHHNATYRPLNQQYRQPGQGQQQRYPTSSGSTSSTTQQNGRNHKLSKISNFNYINNCSKCGTSHKIKMCPAFGVRCNKCNKFNHLARVCRQNYKQVNKVEDLRDDNYVSFLF